jgi:hypothetical protein
LKIVLLRFFALLMFLPGLAGLVANAGLSTHYFDTRSREPEPASLRTVPRSLNGQVVYLTEREDKQLDLLRYYGLRGFGIGIGLGVLCFGAMAANLVLWHEHDAEPETEEILGFDFGADHSNAGLNAGMGSRVAGRDRMD